MITKNGMVTTKHIFDSYNLFIRSTIYGRYRKNMNMSKFIRKITKELKLNHKVFIDGRLMFFQTVNNIRFEVIINRFSNDLNFIDLDCRMINYEYLWKRKKYLLSSTLEKDQDYIYNEPFHGSLNFTL